MTGSAAETEGGCEAEAAKAWRCNEGWVDRVRKQRLGENLNKQRHSREDREHNDR